MCTEPELLRRNCPCKCRGLPPRHHQRRPATLGRGMLSVGSLFDGPRSTRQPIVRAHARAGPYGTSSMMVRRRLRRTNRTEAVVGVTSEANRSVLPIPDAHQPYPGLGTYDAKDPATSFPPIRQIRPPADAANVLVVLLDDVGFAASSAFGGAIDTPTADRLAAGGLRYNR